MSSKRTTRAGTRKLPKAPAGSDSGKTGRQLSIPQMLLRHTEQLSISESPDEPASGPELRPAQNSKGRVNKRAGEKDEAPGSNHSTGGDGDGGLYETATSAAETAVTATSAAETAVTARTRGTSRRKRRASDSQPEETEEFKGIKRRPPAAGTGWIPLASQPEIVRQTSSKPPLPSSTEPDATTSFSSSAAASLTSSTFSVINNCGSIHNDNNNGSGKSTKAHSSKRSSKSSRRSGSSIANSTISEDNELDFLSADYPWTSAADVIAADENAAPVPVETQYLKNATKSSASISVHDIDSLPFISRGRDSTDSAHSLDSRRSSAESCFQLSDVRETSSASARSPRGSAGVGRRSRDAEDCLLTTNSARQTQATPVEQVEGVAAAPTFAPVHRSPLKEIANSYAPLPFQLDEKKKKCLFPVNRLWKSPLPVLSWADPEEVWLVMLQKERMYMRDAEILQKHPSLQARMRSILLDWLTEVCEVYKLHRETFYLAVDFVDRYLTQQENIPKQLLQLIGITALFVAAKIEEIYPPKLMEFAYVTDGACTEDEILTQELLMLKALSWDLSPITVNGWLNIFMQLTNVENIEDSKERFVFPQYSGHAFSQIAQLLDLVVMDIGSLKFPHNLVATAAIHHMASEPLALSVSGLRREDIAECVAWMEPFAAVLRETGTLPARRFPEIADDDQHNIQVHSVDLSLLDAAQAKQEEIRVSRLRAITLTQKLQEGSLAPAVSPKPSRKNDSFLTPPMSSQKHVKRT